MLCNQFFHNFASPYCTSFHKKKETVLFTLSTTNPTTINGYIGYIYASPPLLFWKTIFLKRNKLFWKIRKTWIIFKNQTRKRKEKDFRTGKFLVMINIGFSPDQWYLKNKSEKGQKSITSVLVCKHPYINWIYRLEGEGRKQFVLWQNQKVLPITLPKNLSSLAKLACVFKIFHQMCIFQAFGKIYPNHQNDFLYFNNFFSFLEHDFWLLKGFLVCMQKKACKPFICMDLFFASGIFGGFLSQGVVIKNKLRKCNICPGLRSTHTYILQHSMHQHGCI